MSKKFVEIGLGGKSDFGAIIVNIDKINSIMCECDNYQKTQSLIVYTDNQVRHKIDYEDMTSLNSEYERVLRILTNIDR